MPHHKLFVTMAAAAFAAGAALAQSTAPQAPAKADDAWVPPGTPGSPIDGTLFHAQVLMSAHGFSPGVIDGKAGESFRLALKSFQQASGLEETGELDPQTRVALLRRDRPSTVQVTLTAEDVAGPFVLPFPSDPEAQAELEFLGYRNMLEKVAERYHTTPATVVALNGPDKLIGAGQVLRLPNVLPTARDYERVPGNGGRKE